MHWTQVVNKQRISELIRSLFTEHSDGKCWLTDAYVLVCACNDYASLAINSASRLSAWDVEIPSLNPDDTDRHRAKLIGLRSKVNETA